VRENWLSVSFITDASCHRWRRMSTPYPHAPKVSIARKTCTCTAKALRWQPTAWHSTVLPTLGLPGRAAAGYPDRNRVKPEVGTGVVRIVRCRWHSHGRVANEAA
jgi:hypothetical protein